MALFVVRVATAPLGLLMANGRKLIFSVSGFMALVLFLTMPLPLISYIARHPGFNEQLFWWGAKCYI